MRLNHLDVARALCIVLVVFGHSEIAKHHPQLNAALASFRMPLFLIISGTFFQPLRSTSDILLRKSESLLKPYLVLALLYAPFYLLTSGHDDSRAYALGVLSFNGPAMPGWLFPMWFLTLLWTLHVGGAWFIKLTRFDTLPRGEQFAWIVMLMLTGYASMKGLWMRSVHIGDSSWHLAGLPFNLDLWPLASGFFLTGYVLKREIRHSVPGWRLLCASAALFVLVHALYQPSVSLLKRQYPEFIVTTVAAFSGALLLIGLAHAVARSRRATRSLQPLGRLSLYILMFHAPVLSLCGKTLRSFLPSEPVVTEVMAIIVSLGVSLALGKMIEMTPVLRLLFEPSRGVRPTPAIQTQTASRLSLHEDIEMREAA